MYRRIRNTIRFYWQIQTTLTSHRHGGCQYPVSLDKLILKRADKRYKTTFANLIPTWIFTKCVKRWWVLFTRFGRFYLDIIKDRQYTTKANGEAPFSTNRDLSISPMRYCAGLHRFCHLPHKKRGKS